MKRRSFLAVVAAALSGSGSSAATPPGFYGTMTYEVVTETFPLPGPEPESIIYSDGSTVDTGPWEFQRDFWRITCRLRGRDCTCSRDCVQGFDPEACNRRTFGGG